MEYMDEVWIANYKKNNGQLDERKDGNHEEYTGG